MWEAYMIPPPKNLRSSQPDHLDAEGQQLDDVGAVADAAVGHDLDLAEHLRRVAVDLVGDLDGRRRVVELPPAVVGDVDGRGAPRDRLERVLDRADALGDHGQRGPVADLVI